MPVEIATVWIWTTILLVVGVFVTTARKTLPNISRKSLLDRQPGHLKERFQAYLDSLAHYDAALRFADQMVRMALVACAVLGFVGQGYEVGFGSTALLALVVFAAFLVGLELVPAIMARLSPERLLILILPVLDGLYRLIKTPMRAFEYLVNSGASVLGSQPARETADVVEEEILSAAEEGEREGILRKSEISMIESIVEFHDRNVTEVLTPRTEMVAIDADLPLDEYVQVALDCGHSRLPVYRGNHDKIIGMLYVKDLLRFFKEGATSSTGVEDILRVAHFVPETKKVSELLQEFKTQRFHIAVVIDEFGGTSGLVTIEDIIEEILGEIENEADPGRKDEVRAERIVRIREDLVEIDARLSVYDLNRELKGDGSNGNGAPAIPYGEGFDTVGGFLSSSLGRIPAVGETYAFGSFRFEVLDADERTLRRIRIEILSESSAES
jgi:CBS domain containing-hemolysin-like protein